MIGYKLKRIFIFFNKIKKYAEKKYEEVFLGGLL